MKAPKPIIKSSSEITDQELEEMQQIYLLANDNMPEEHIRRNHIKKTRPEFYLFKVNGKIRAFQAISCYKVQTPFKKRPLKVFFIHLSYKHPEAGPNLKNFAFRTNAHKIRKELGPLWFLKDFLMVLHTCNPRLFGRLSHFFSSSYPKPHVAIPEEVKDFVQGFLAKYLALPEGTFDDQWVRQSPYENPTPINRDWDQQYSSYHAGINDFFKNREIILDQGEGPCLSGRAMLFVGHYQPRAMLARKIRTKKGR